MANNALYFLTGSSASGKTTLLKGVIASVYPGLMGYHFDDLGVPSLDEMKARYGSSDGWQAANARLWIDKIAALEGAGVVVLDGQVRPTVILQAAREAGFSALHITLIDCSHAERRRRLLETRVQPELDTLDMYAWAAYLHGQADVLGLEILDTTSLSLEEAIRRLAASIERFAKETGLPWPPQQG
jgi:hypothetical protein